ncbi:MAG TPA: hypothetical protein VNU68_28315 [Verrucomicrobiae bacterium]|nr:hypothetical protein [Verrucomicrobiae bacterium]
MNVLAKLNASELRAAAAEKFAAGPEVFDPVSILVPALRSVGALDAANRRLWEHSAEFLLGRRGRAPEAPKDWRQQVKLSCTCADCRELQKFVLDRALAVLSVEYFEDLLAGYGDFESPLWEIFEATRNSGAHATMDGLTQVFDSQWTPAAYTCRKEETFHSFLQNLCGPESFGTWVTDRKAGELWHG